MRVTLIAEALPPAPFSGAQRAGHVARTLREAGFEVRAIVPRRPGLRVSEGLVDRVTPVAVWPGPADLLGFVGRARASLAGRGAVGAESPAAAGTSAEPPDPFDPGPRLRRWITATLRFPDARLGFLPPAVRAALDPGQPPADVVYTTGPPVTAHLTGLAIRASGGPAWVAEYRDPWILDGVPLRPPSLRSAWTDALERALEARCLAEAEEVVAVTEGIARHLAPRRAAAHAAPPSVIRNGIPRIWAESHERLAGPRRIVHLGNLYGFRDPRPFLLAVADLAAERSWGPEDISVEFVGAPPAPAFVGFAERHGLGEIVRFRGWVAHEEGQRCVRDADVLLLLAQRQPLQVPNKLYEYLGSRTPILAFVDRDGESAAMLRRVGATGIVTEGDGRERVRMVLAELLDGGRATVGAEHAATLEAWTTSRQMARLPEIVGRAAARR